jgi:hypothetical protein
MKVTWSAQLITRLVVSELSRDKAAINNRAAELRDAGYTASVNQIAVGVWQLDAYKLR